MSLCTGVNFVLELRNNPAKKKTFRNVTNWLHEPKLEYEVVATFFLNIWLTLTQPKFIKRQLYETFLVKAFFIQQYKNCYYH